MNKKERKLLSKGESLYFEAEDGDYKVSAETISVEIFEKMKESVDSKKIVLEEKMEKRKDSKEEVLVKKELEGKDGEVSKEEIIGPAVFPALGSVEEVSEEGKLPDGISEKDLKDPEEVLEEDLPEETGVEADEESEAETDEVFGEEDLEGVEPSEELFEEEEEVEKPKPAKAQKKQRVPREPDPCPGVSAREHWPLFRNRWFVFFAMLILVGALLVAFYVGSNYGGNKMSLVPAKNSVMAEVITAQRNVKDFSAYFTGSGNWKTEEESKFSIEGNFAVLWVYFKGGIPYYDKACLSRIPFSNENAGNLKNASSSIGPVTLSDDGVAWILDSTGEEVVFLSGLKQDLAKEVANFTAGGAKKPAFSEVVSEAVETISTVEAVILPISLSSNAIVNYNTGDGSGWKALSVADWNGKTTGFELWNFGSEDSSTRYWDKDLKDPVPVENPGNYFWHRGVKSFWDSRKAEVLPLK